MRLCNRLIPYFFLIYFCFSHDLNHIDPATVKQDEESIPITSDATTIETSNVHLRPTDDVRKPIDNSNLDIPSSTSATPVQTDSQTQTINDTTVVQNESQSSGSKVPRKLHIHPRHIPTEEAESQALTNDSSQKPKSVSTKEDSNGTTSTDGQNHTLAIHSLKNRQICWHLPKTFQPSIELLENQLFHLINNLPDFLQTIVFGRIDDREVLMNTMWFGSICTMCFLFSFLFISMGTKRLKQTKQEKEVRSRCQHLQRHNNQIELERATFERQNQKLSEQIDELKNLAVRDTDEDLFVLRTECTQLHEEAKTVRTERDTLQQTIDQRDNLIRKYQYEMKGQIETMTQLNNQIRQLKEDLEKQRTTVNRIQSNDFSIERFEKSEETIQELRSTITQLTQDKFLEHDQLREIHEHSKQLRMDNHQLTHRMKQLKGLLEQRNGIIKQVQEKIQTDDELEADDLLSLLTEQSSGEKGDLLSTIDEDIRKSKQHMEELHTELEVKTRRVKELEIQCKQEKDRCREMETKLKVVLELRERDAHIHIRQLGQTDAELRKARTDTDRVRILQQQLDLKQQQFDDIQKVHSHEQTKFNEDCSKLQRETHEKWMEVKRLTRELDTSKKECESLRKQITKYGTNGRLSQEKTMSPHYGDSDATSTSPISHQQGENFRPIDHQRNDSGATSPTEMFIPRPPQYGFPRPPFYPSTFMPPPPPNLFMMHPRFPMANLPPHGAISPTQHLIINGNETNSAEMVDFSNLTPNSLNYDGQTNDSIHSPSTNDEKPNKSKKVKKSTKKKTRTSAMIEDV